MHGAPVRTGRLRASRRASMSPSKVPAPRSMNSTAYLVSSAAVMVAVISTFLIVPHVMHAPNRPGWLTSTATVFAAVFMMAALVALSIVNLSGALLVHIPHATAALAIACALHMLTWSALRKVFRDRVRFGTLRTSTRTTGQVSPSA